MVLWAHASKAPNGISIGSAVFAQHTPATNRQTDTQTTLLATSVAIGRIYAVHAMQPKTVSSLCVHFSTMSISSSIT